MPTRATADFNGSDAEERTGSPSRFVLGASATFLALLFFAEIGSRLAVKSGFLYRKVDLSGALSSLPELRDRIAWAASRPLPVLLLGDSVLGASALVEHRVKNGRRQTIPVFLEEIAGRQGWNVASLGADGLLIPDLEAICAEIPRAPPQRIVVLLNFRMFASEFEKPAAALSRDFLHSGVTRALVWPRSPADDVSLDERVSTWAVEHSFLLRTTRLLKPLWYFPTRRDFYRRLIERVPGRNEDLDIREAALRLKVAPYYRERWKTSSLSFRVLGALLKEMSNFERVVVVLTPQNPDFIEDHETFKWNRRVLRDFIQSRRAGSVAYRDFADRFPADQFLDHCHLTPEGNRDYARALSSLVRS
jgi:hypothetical protein